MASGGAVVVLAAGARSGRGRLPGVANVAYVAGLRILRIGVVSALCVIGAFLGYAIVFFMGSADSSQESSRSARITGHIEY